MYYYYVPLYTLQWVAVGLLVAIPSSLRRLLPLFQGAHGMDRREEHILGYLAYCMKDVHRESVVQPADSGGWV